MTTNNPLPSTTRSAITTTTTLLHWLYITITILLLLITALTAADPALTPQATTIIVVTVTATTAATPTVPHPPSYTSLDLFANTILSVTNTYRQAHNASNLIWNKSLAEYAKKWAEGWDKKHGPYGENLAFGFPNASAAVAAWGDEGLRYNFRDPTGFTEETGHFTQLVWRATTEVGCAAVDCGVDLNDGKDSQGTKNGDTANKNGNHSGNGNGNGNGNNGGSEGINGIQRPQGWYVVCEYTPPGNVIGGNEKLGDKAFFRINVQASSTYSGPWQTAGNNGGSKTSVASIARTALGFIIVCHLSYYRTSRISFNLPHTLEGK
ncbi:putative extracellular SCP domain protein Pry1 [Aspergillus aculeatinus CBS 121060]|uniref:PR-1-like protein n=1 Tax=Aspergillus aculeatinus CBS 121060 TaxID=1448322 RepID=A0ACD1H0B8_9EURO|nr:PR-1-like protein [Aspergillus aculeatinus CBS 121060]RAH67061.1 PR-1-like protein [Aspergillus aculeatinus CBS 121060]